MTFLDAAHEVATMSPDPVTKNGAVLVQGGKIVGRGFNGFPYGLEEKPERWLRPVKYDYVIHAEVAALIDGWRNGADPHDCTLYAVWYACPECAKVIIASGVRRVVGAVRDLSPAWADRVGLGLSMLAEAGVRCDWG